MTHADIDKEYDTWLVEQIEALQQGKLEDLDVPNLIEELEALVRGEKSAVESYTYQIMIHLLLLDYWTEEYERNYRHWLSEVETFRFQLENKLSTNLRNLLEERRDYIYNKARKIVIVKTGMKDRFPLVCPYSLSNVLGQDP